jgi:hypothetical protein
LEQPHGFSFVSNPRRCSARSFHEPSPSAEADSHLYVLLLLCQKTRAYRTFRPQRILPVYREDPLSKVKSSLSYPKKSVKQNRDFFAKKMKFFSFFSKNKNFAAARHKTTAS